MSTDFLFLAELLKERIPLFLSDNAPQGLDTRGFSLTFFMVVAL